MVLKCIPQDFVPKMTFSMYGLGFINNVIFGGKEGYGYASSGKNNLKKSTTIFHQKKSTTIYHSNNFLQTLSVSQ